MSRSNKLCFASSNMQVAICRTLSQVNVPILANMKRANKPRLLAMLLSMPVPLQSYTPSPGHVRGDLFLQNDIHIQGTLSLSICVPAWSFVDLLNQMRKAAFQVTIHGHRPHPILWVHPCEGHCHSCYVVPTNPPGAEDLGVKGFWCHALTQS